MTDTAGTMSDAEQWRLRDEREFLVRSLEDARREREAGDLSEEDYGLLRERDERRLADVDASLATVAQPTDAPGDAGTDAPRPPTPRTGGPRQRPVRRPQDGRTAASSPSSWPATLAAPDAQATDDPAAPDTPRAPGRAPGRRRIWLVVLGVAFLVAGAVSLMLDLTAPKQAGPTTNTNAPIAVNQVKRLLAEANEAAANGNDTTAISLYGEVISLTSSNAEALAAWGWLDWRAALNTKKATATVAAEGQSAVEHAVSLDKKLYAAQFYLGDIYYQENQYKKAVTHLAAFLADDPPTAWLQNASLVIRSAYTKDGQPVPSGVPLPVTVSPSPSPAASSGSGSTTSTG